MEKDCISIVVPVYNVEDYLFDCLQSLKEQSYENIEIIMVNDGSTDKSEEICKRFCDDRRFILVNKNNGGLSSARNIGIEKAQGKYISFVDSDDFVDKNFILSLYNAIIKHNSDIAVCGYKTCLNKNNIIKEFRYTNSGIIDKTQLFYSILTEESIANFACNKLFSITLFNDIRFPLGKSYEDVFTTYQLFDKAKSVSICLDTLYNYRIRGNSITKSTSKKNLKDALDASVTRANYILNKYPCLSRQCNDSILSCMVTFYHWCAKNGLYDADAQILHESIYKLIRSEKEISKNNSYFDAILIVIFPRIYIKINCIIAKMIQILNGGLG